MSSKFKFISIALVALLAVGVFVATAKADVTGSFETHFLLIPQTTATEVELIDFDVQNALNVTAVISGLSSTFHTHFGIAGVEDVILSTDVSLGALDVHADLVFGRFAGFCAVPFAQICLVPVWDTLPDSDELLFIKKRVEATLTLGGVEFSNLAIFEDTNFTQGDGFEGQSQAFAFGDVFSVAGQTPSGVFIGATTGICAEAAPNVIKKHTWPFRVNEHCAPVQDNTIPSPGTFEDKPDILFDFEDLTIAGVPVAPNVTATSNLFCERITACQLTTIFNFSGGPVPISVTLFFIDLLTLGFDEAEITFTSGAGTLVLTIGSDGTLEEIDVAVNATLNPDTNPATLALTLEAVPGVGLTQADLNLTIQRAGLILGMFFDFDDAVAPGQLGFSDAIFSLTVPGSLLSISATSVFTLEGLVQAEIFLTINF